MRYLIEFCSRPEVASDVMSCVLVDQVGRDVRTTFGDSKSNRSRDVGLPHFVPDERRTTTPAYAGHHLSDVMPTNDYFAVNRKMVTRSSPQW